MLYFWLQERIINVVKLKTKINRYNMTQLDYDLDNYLNELDKEFECYECGTSISKEGYCSRECYKAGQE